MGSEFGGETAHRSRHRVTTTAVLVAAVVAGFAGTSHAAWASTPTTPYGIGDPVAYPTGAYPQSVAVGDLNGDGATDLVTADISQSVVTIGVLLADGNGGYQTAVSYPTDFHSIGRVAVADVTGEGNLDVVLTGDDPTGHAAVAVLAGNGTGALGTATDYSTNGDVSFGLALLDVNNDGYLDLAVTDYIGAPPSGSVAVLLSDGAGSFAPPVTYPVGVNPKDVVFADITHDGNPDLVVANYGSGTVSVLAGNGSGQFGAAASYSVGTDSHPYGLAADDLNGDGYPDVVVTKYDYDEVSVLLNDGSGGLGAATDLATGGNGTVTNVAIADIDGDGNKDLIAIDNQPRIFTGLGDGTFAAARGTGSWNDIGLVVTDLDGDNRPDLVTATDGDPGAAVVFLQEPVPTKLYAPTVTHHAVSGGVLFAGGGAWTGSPTQYAFDWQRCDATGCVDAGAPDSSVYVPDDSDVGYSLRVVVTASNTAGSSTPAHSLRTTVVKPRPAATTAPSISSTEDGTVLVGDRGVWSGDPTSYAYYWWACDAAGENCDYVASGKTLTMTQYLVGHRMQLEVVASGASGFGEAYALSDPVVGVAPSNQTLPTIAGSAVVGATLTADQGVWWGTRPREFRYQWQRCTGTGSCTAIPHASGTSYTVTTADLDDTLVVRVTARNAYGLRRATSAPTAPVSPTA